MGSLASKAWTDMNDYYYESCNNSEKKDVESTDDRTPVRSVGVSLDPRSPTFQFDRTPIQVIDTKCRQTIDLTDKVEGNGALLNSLSDPRSPTLGIDRTPIDLAAQESMVAKISAMHLSFDSNVLNLGDNSSDSLISEDKCLSSTPLNDSKKEVKKREDNGSQRVRTPLGCVQQKQTPNRNLIKQRKQLEITKKAHLNSHLKKTKTIADNSTDTSLRGHNIIDEKENY